MFRPEICLKRRISEQIPCVNYIVGYADRSETCVMHIGDKIRYLRKQRGWTLEELAFKAGTDTGNLSKLETGKMGYSSDKLNALAGALGVQVVDFFTPMDRDGVEGGERTYVPSRVPVVGEARLGDRGFYDEHAAAGGRDGWVEYQAKNKNTYALRCRGDSMWPRILNGEYVIIDPHAQIRVLDQVAVHTEDGRRMIKTFASRSADGVITLTSINGGSYPPLTLDEHEIKTMHRVKGTVAADDYIEE